MNEQQKQSRLERWRSYKAPIYRRWRVYSTFLTGITIGFAYVMLLSKSAFGGATIDQGQYAFVLIFSGILGGVVYTILIDEHVEMPRFIANKGDKFEAGLFGDILLGIAGAVVLDFIATKQFGAVFESNVELAAAGIVGGYGGRAILQFALQRVFKDVNLLDADRQAVLQTNLQRRLERMDSLELIDWVNQQIKVGLSDAELSKLCTEIQQAEPGIRKRIFNLIQEFRLSAKAAGERERIIRMMPLFEALLQGDSSQHRYYAELAFVYKDSGSTDFFQPLQYLDKAIALRGDRQRAETWNYELSRAITRIQQAHQRNNSYEFDSQTEDLIIQDLLAVASIYNFETLLKDIENDNVPLPLLNWARHNKAQLLAREDTADVGLKIVNFLESESTADSPQLTEANLLVETAPVLSSILSEAEQVSDVTSTTERQKINRGTFFKEYRNVFPIKKISQEQVDVFDAIFDYWDKSKHTDLRWLSYAMATAYHETGARMVPVREGFADDDASAIKAVEQLLARGRISWNYAKPEANGQSYFGRGLVQITHQDNYLKLGQAIGLGTKLKDNPSLALDKDISVLLLFKGMEDGLYCAGHKLSIYFNQEKEDWYGARAMINGDKHYQPKWANGTSIGQLIAKYGRDFHRCCRASAIDISVQSLNDNQDGEKIRKHWIEAVQETWLKKSTDPADLIVQDQKKRCVSGKKYAVESYQKEGENHYFVKLSNGLGNWYILDSPQENYWDTTWENDHGEADESGSQDAEERIENIEKESTGKQPVGEQLTKDMPFDTLITPHITYGEFALYREERRFIHNYQCKAAYEICLFLEDCRKHFGNKPIVITSGYRPPRINRRWGGASNSEHLYDYPDKGAVDFYIKGVDIFELEHWCDEHYPHSIGYGAKRGFIHLGFRPGKDRIRWVY